MISFVITIILPRTNSILIKIMYLSLSDQKRKFVECSLVIIFLVKINGIDKQATTKAQDFLK